MDRCDDDDTVAEARQGFDGMGCYRGAPTSKNETRTMVVRDSCLDSQNIHQSLDKNILEMWCRVNF